MYTKRLLVTAQGGGNNADQQPNSMAPSPLLDLVHEFYTHLNSKDVRRLEKLFDPNCVIEDEAYYQPLEGMVRHLTINIISFFYSTKFNEVVLVFECRKFTNSLRN
jgi:ketosteroid isomerase-like protein